MENTDMGGEGRKQERASRGTCLCLQSVVAAERREEEGFFNQADVLLSRAPSFIRIDPYTSPSTTGRAITPVASAVGEASTCRHVCV